MKTCRLFIILFLTAVATISCERNDLYEFAVNSGAKSWQPLGSTRCITSGSVSIVSLKANAGNVYAAYEDGANSHAPTVRTFTSGSWTSPEVVSSDSVDMLSLFIEGTTPYVLYQNSTPEQYIYSRPATTWASGSWGAVGTSSVMYASFIIAGGQPFFASVTGVNLSAKTYTSGWYTLGAGIISCASSSPLILSTNGTNVFLTYTHGTNNTVSVLTRLVSDGTSTVWTTISDNVSSGLVSCLDFKIYGTSYYVAYSDATTNKTTVKKYNGSSWDTLGSADFSAGAAYCVSLDIDTNGTPYIAYQDAANSNGVSVQKYNGSTWEYVGTANFNGGAAAPVTLVLNGTTPVVAFGDGTSSGKLSVFCYK